MHSHRPKRHNAKPRIEILGDPKRGGGSYRPRAGQSGRLEFGHCRRGTRGLVAAVRADASEVVHHNGYDKDRRFDSAETIAFIEQLRAKLATAGYRRNLLVPDDGSTHR